MSSQNPAIPVAPVFVGSAAEIRLQKLGMPGTEVLVDALQDGASGARATTENHPVAYRGQRMWGETVASLREGLKGHGWDGEYLSGVDLVRHRSSGVAVVVTAGDSATGLPNYRPQVRYERCGVVQALVNGGYDTLWEAAKRPEWEVWFLLHRLDGLSLQAELSLPAEIGTNGWVTGWAERVLLPHTSFGRGRGSSVPGDNTGPARVDVEVQRRVG
jgi:hypothetical protein